MDQGILTAARLRELLDYDPESGIFTRLVKTTNSVHVGDVAGSVHPRGYRFISVDGRPYRAHRLAWLWIHGVWPAGIDHINGARDDNRILNLRNVSPSENSRNTAKRKDNTSGCPGVCWHAQAKRWRVRVFVEKRRIVVGFFKELSEAVAARKRAESLHGYHPNHGRANTITANNAPRGKE